MHWLQTIREAIGHQKCNFFEHFVKTDVFELVNVFLKNVLIPPVKFTPTPPHPLQKNFSPKGRGKKNTVFFYFLSKGGRGGLGQSKKSLSENTQIFLTKGGGSHPIQKGFIRKTEIFWHNLPKKGGFIKKTGIFLTISAKNGKKTTSFFM